MTNRVEGGRATSLDIDDVIFNRGPLVRNGAALWAARKTQTLPTYTLENLPHADRTVVDTPITKLTERISYEHHARREPIPGIKEILQKLVDNGNTLFANTGRHSTRPWVDMTLERLDETGLAPMIETVLFTPPDMKTAVSKANGIKELYEKGYDDVEHIDDDPRTDAFLAKLFPDSQFHLVPYKSTNLLYPEKKIKDLTNIHRINGYTNRR